MPKITNPLILWYKIQFSKKDLTEIVPERVHTVTKEFCTATSANCSRDIHNFNIVNNVPVITDKVNVKCDWVSECVGFNVTLDT